MKHRMIILFVLLSVLLILGINLYLIKQKFFNQKLKTPYFDFCSTQLTKANEKLTMTDPTTYIQQSIYKDELSVWKNNLLKKQNWTEQYFNQHIRIEKVDNQEYRNLIIPWFSFIQDWFVVTLQDAINTQNMQIEWDVDSFPTSTNLPSCSEVVYAFKKLHTTLAPNYVGIYNRKSFVAWGSVFESNGMCSSAQMDILTKEFSYTNIETPCLKGL